jgi:hypothetical protein
MLQFAARRLISIAVFAAAILSVAGCASSSAAAPKATVTPTVTPTATLAVTTFTPAPTVVAGSPTPAGFSTFRSSDGAYSINFPSAWGTKPASVNGVTAQLFGSGDQADVFAVLPLTPAVTADKYPAIVSAFLGKDGVNGSDVRVFPATTTTLIGATTWTRLTATFTAQSLPASLIAYVAPHGSGTYALLSYAPDATFAQVYQTDFGPMAQSFAFLQ